MWPRTGLWRHRDFLALWAAQSVSAIGSRVTRTGIPVIAVLSVGGSASELGLLSAIAVAPGALVGLLAGGHIERALKRRILIGADLARALLVLSIPIAAWLDRLTMAQLCAVAAAIGCASALFDIADSAYLPALVPRDRLLEGNAKLGATDSVAEVAGPGLAGVLIEWLTAPVAMLLDALSYLGSALLLRQIRTVELPVAPGAGDGVLRDLRAGLLACWSEPLVRPLLLVSAVSSLSGGFFAALYMLYALGELGLSPAAVGFIIGAGGVGSLLGALLSTRLAGWLAPGPRMLVCLSIYQASGLLIPLTSGAGGLSVALLTAHQCIGDGFATAYLIESMSLRQMVLPARLLARAGAVFELAGGILLPGGALLAGAAAESIGVRPALWVGVGCGLAAPFLLLPLRALSRADWRRLEAAPRDEP